MVRRLKVLNAPQGEDAEAAERSPLSWVAIAASLTTLLFFPLSLLGARVGAELAGLGFGASLAAAPLLLLFCVPAAGCAALAGRFGLRTTARHGAAAGALSGLVTITLAAPGLANWRVLTAALTLLVAAGAVSGFLGARFGIRRRPQAG